MIKSLFIAERLADMISRINQENKPITIEVIVKFISNIYAQLDILGIPHNSRKGLFIFVGMLLYLDDNYFSKPSIKSFLEMHIKKDDETLMSAYYITPFNLDKSPLFDMTKFSLFNTKLNTNKDNENFCGFVKGFLIGKRF